MLTELGKNRVHRMLQKFNLRFMSASEHKFSYDKENFDVGEIPIIFDVGANIGQSSVWFRKSFPKATIHAFEPFEVIFRELTNNSDAICHKFGFGAKEEVVRVAPPNSAHDQQANLRTLANEGGEEILVKTIDGFCENNNIPYIDILKSDTEGFELEVLRGAARMLDNIGNILVEATLVSPKHTHLFDLVEVLMPTHSLFSIFDAHHAERTGGLKYFNALFKKSQ